MREPVAELHRGRGVQAEVAEGRCGVDGLRGGMAEDGGGLGLDELEDCLVPRPAVSSPASRAARPPPGSSALPCPARCGCDQVAQQRWQLAGAGPRGQHAGVDPGGQHCRAGAGQCGVEAGPGRGPGPPGPARQSVAGPGRVRPGVRSRPRPGTGQAARAAAARRPGYPGTRRQPRSCPAQGRPAPRPRRRPSRAQPGPSSRSPHAGARPRPPRPAPGHRGPWSRHRRPSRPGAPPRLADRASRPPGQTAHSSRVTHVAGSHPHPGTCAGQPGGQPGRARRRGPVPGSEHQLRLPVPAARYPATTAPSVPVPR